MTMTRRKRMIIWAVTALGGIALFVTGFYREEIGEVMFNAAML